MSRGARLYGACRWPGHSCARSGADDCGARRGYGVPTQRVARFVTAGESMLVFHLGSQGPMRAWRNGRRAGFRCQCPQGRGGSSPLIRTKIEILVYTI